MVDKVSTVIGALMFGAVLYGEEITIPLDDGSIVIKASFIRKGITGSYVPYLSYFISNKTSSSRTLKLRFNIGGLCREGSGSVLRQWSIPIETSISKGWFKDGEDYFPALEVEGCKTEIITATLLLEGQPGEPDDLSSKLTVFKIKRDAEWAEQRIADEEQAKKSALESARQKQLAAERKKKQAEEDARYAKIRAAGEAKKAEERAKIQAACAVIYKATSNKKVGDLTVKQEQEVRSCQALGLYSP